MAACIYFLIYLHNYFLINKHYVTLGISNQELCYTAKLYAWGNNFLYTYILNYSITYPVCDTHITWLQTAKVICRSLLVMIALASANPNNE